MNSSINLQGKAQTELQTLQSKITFDFFAPETTEAMRDEMTVLGKEIDKCLPHSFVLADLFDVEGMTLDIPDYVYELNPCIGFTECPDCEGEGWLEVEGSAWYNRAWTLHTFTSMKPCLTCNCEGQVFTALKPVQDVPDDESLVHTNPLPQTWLLAA